MTDTPTPPAMTPELFSNGLSPAQAERLAMQAAIDSAEISGSITTDGNLWRFWARMAKDSAAKTKEAQAEIARLTAALATAREDGMREAAKLLILTGPADYDEYDLVGRQSKGFDMGIDWSREAILSAIRKGAAT